MGLEKAYYYHSLIGIIRQIVEKGCIDINTKASQISSYLTIPREGHTAAAIHVMDYLKFKHNSRLVFDHPIPNRSD